jgi:AraC-like DNA-binding protein/predicted dithiol-disulfide oxidoreductase (DUF899 family)
MVEEAGREQQYVAAISRVLEFIQEHLDEEITPGMLAREACFSQHHFHRVFRAVVGESVMDHVRRLRLERAAYHLKADGGSSVGRIAFDAGYGAQEAFTRIFNAYFGMSPKAYRQSPVSYLIPASCGVHFGPSNFTPLRSLYDPSMMDDSRLCPLHRNMPKTVEEGSEWAGSVITMFAELFFPPQLKLDSLEGQMTKTTTIDTEIETIEREIEAAKLRLIEARRRRAREDVQDYTFKSTDGRDVKLSELFGDKDDLIIVHNMGTGCSYCTMWADGFNGLAPHLSDRAAFVLVSPDKPEVQKRFAEKRPWNFRTVSCDGAAFASDMGFENDKGEHWPGISTFHREPDGKIVRIAKTFFDQNDDYCAVWPILELLKGGPGSWQPKYDY